MTKREYNRQWSEKKSRVGADIGLPNPPVDPKRKAAACASLRSFCESYFPTKFTLSFSPDHLQVIARMQDAILHGGQFALAMPRASGKTTLSEVACLWAILTGRHQFVMLIAVSATRAVQLLESIKTELLCNDLLHEDFAEVTHAIRRLENRANRAKGQTINGTATHIGWRREEVVLPYVEGSAASQAILRVAGLTSGSIRGAKFVRPHDGRTVRVSLCVIDDAQSDQSAHSIQQCETRKRLLEGAILGLAGANQKITALACVTVIRKGDLADTLLDRRSSPLWTGQRYQLLYSFPERMDLWAEYAERRNDEFRNDGDGRLATIFYAEHRAAMDKGAQIAWADRKKPDEISALQHAMNLFFADKEAFFAEYQNAPLEEELSTGQLKADDIEKRTNNIARLVVPQHCTKLTAYIDCQQKCLFYTVVAFADNFSSAVIDYGSYPDQRKKYFTLAEVQHTLQRTHPGGIEASLHAGLKRLTELLSSRTYTREDGTAMRLDKLLIDANWQTETVYTFCRNSSFPALPAHGRYVGAASKSFSEYQKKPGEQLGTHWLVTNSNKRAQRHILIDGNYWKSFTAERLTTAPHDKGSLLLFSGELRMFAEQCCSEYRVQTEGRGRRLDEWKLKPDRPDNHLWDCLVGCQVAASTLGVSLLQSTPQIKKRISLKELQQQKQRTHTR